MSELKNFDNYFDLNGKVALITGGTELSLVEMLCSFSPSHPGSRGLGLHAATAILKAGAKTVIITARKREGPQGINQAVDKLNSLRGITGKAVGIAANVAQTEEIERLVKEAQSLEGKLDILIVNAGATWGGQFESTPDWSNQKILDLNVRGAFNLARL